MRGECLLPDENTEKLEGLWVGLIDPKYFFETQYSEGIKRCKS